MELLDVVDENNNLIGKQEDREIVHRDGLWHREIAIWIINEKCEILLQKRALTKKQDPNKWDITAGHVDAGEEPLNVAKRETLEEIGLDLKENEIEFLFVEKMEKKFSEEQYNRIFNYIYLAKTYKDISEYVIQKEELSEVKYFDMKELEKEIKKQNTEFAFSKEDYIVDVINLLKNIIKN